MTEPGQKDDTGKIARRKSAAVTGMCVLGFLLLVHFLIPRLGFWMLVLLGVWILGLIGLWKFKQKPDA